MPVTTGAPRRHIYVPDTQIRKGVPIDHIAWIGQYVADHGCDELILAGDWWDMPSLSMHDALGSLPMEGARYEDDIAAGNAALELFVKPIDRLPKAKRPRRRITLGNHEDRIDRAIMRDPRYAGTIGIHHINASRLGFEVHPFLEVVDVDGIWYSHYFAQPLSGRPYGGTVDNRLNKIGHSFTQGHEQVFRYSPRTLANGQEQHGLVAGAAYLHAEAYKGLQGNRHWRGIVVKHEVSNGSYDLMRVSLGYLCRRYEGVPLCVFMAKKYPEWAWLFEGGASGRADETSLA